MESSLDGSIIRPNILQTTTPVVGAIGHCPALSPTLSQNPQYPYYNIARQATTSSNATIASGKLTPSPAPTPGGSSLLIVPVVSSRPPTRTLTHHSHPHHNQSYRERAKLSSQSMSSGSYRTPKTKLDDDNSHLGHSTSYLNVDPSSFPCTTATASAAAHAATAPAILPSQSLSLGNSQQYHLHVTPFATAPATPVAKTIKNNDIAALTYTQV